MAAIIETATDTEARFLLDGEVFERHSITYTVVWAIERTDTEVSFAVMATYLDGTTVLEELTLPARLRVFVTQRYVR